MAKKKSSKKRDWYKEMRRGVGYTFMGEVADSVLRIIALIILGMAVLAILDGVK